MQPPIAEVPSLPPDTKKESFLALNVVCGLLFVALVVGCIEAFFEIKPPDSKDLPEPIYYFVVRTFLVLSRMPYFLFLYFLWRRHNWARLVLTAVCIFGFIWALWDVITANNPYKVTSLLKWAFDCLLALFTYIFLPIWLNLPSVKARFVSSK